MGGLTAATQLASKGATVAVLEKYAVAAAQKRIFELAMKCVALRPSTLRHA